jgi:exodeoxyribonuclease VII large subunit
MLARRLARGLGGQAELCKERLERTADRLGAAVQRQLQIRRHRLEQLAATLDALSPLKVLERGYAVARDEAGHVLKRAADFSPGLAFQLGLADGEVRARTVEGDA